jgi:8-oxo-dGTP pyrophosphatase MutT (NUDIX family)
VLRFEDRYLLAIHSSFWAKSDQRWGLPGGGIERGEAPVDAVQRELEEELDIYINDFTELGAFYYKGHDHMIFGAESHRHIDSYDEKELLDLRWFSLLELQDLDRQRKFHAGYELQAIRQFIALVDH